MTKEQRRAKPNFLSHDHNFANVLLFENVLGKKSTVEIT